MKLIFFDTETTGLDARVHGIHQLAGEIVIDNRVVERFDFKVKPFKGCEFVPDALEVSKTSLADILQQHQYRPEADVYMNFTCMLQQHIENMEENDKYFLIGWRVPEFDVKFLKALFYRYSLPEVFDSYFWTNPIDIKALASHYLLEERPLMASFSLAPVAKYLGVKVDETKLHTAAYDAYLSRRVYDIVKKTRV